MIARLGDTVLAQSDDTIVIEGNHYFPPDSVNMEYFSEKTKQHTTCPWKGEADYFTVTVGDKVMENIAWTYAKLSDMALDRVKKNFNDYIAFYPQITVSEE